MKRHLIYFPGSGGGVPRVRRDEAVLIAAAAGAALPRARRPRRVGEPRVGEVHPALVLQPAVGRVAVDRGQHAPPDVAAPLVDHVVVGGGHVEPHRHSLK